jgi:crossover junction endodeoxyribonuclease RuvC
MRLIGLDPGLRTTGWGVIEADGNRLRHVANGRVQSKGEALGDRLRQLFDGLSLVMTEWQPDAAAVEETFVNQNPASTLKLGQARGVVILSAVVAGVPVHEYTPNLVKKSIVGAGHAAKEQVEAMVRRLLPGVSIDGPDAADALAVAICHAHHHATQRTVAKAVVMAGARP